ncbi:MAG: efflux RND transporter periplasmic adaptor subunit [Verrucomicrobia bacterium]|nr:efflux RND transporter periplasmic adaptor subunit [Verrucomicrobiota bacterium]
MANAASKTLTWLVVLALLAGGAFFGYRYWQKLPKAGPEYRTVTVTRGELTQAVTATGTLNPVVNVQVGSQISGIIQKIFVDYNSAVTNGQLIAQIDPATYIANVHQAEGDLANARAGLELAQVSFKRDKLLLEEKLIPASDFDKTVATLHQAEAQVKIREAALEKAKVDLMRTSINAPINGVVISRNVDVGQTVAASFNTPTLFVIANDLAKMQIDANVSEADVGGIELDQEVSFTVDAFLNRTFRGKVMQIRNAPITVQNVVTYDTVIEVNNADLKLKPGMTANVSITTAQREDALKVSNAALRFRPPESTDDKKGPGTNLLAGASGSPSFGSGRGMGGRTAGGGGGGTRQRGERSPVRTVYILSRTNSASGAALVLQPARIKVGISDGVFTEVLEGLKEGDEVVIGTSTPTSEAPSGQPANPFGGGMRRF